MKKAKRSKNACDLLAVRETQCFFNKLDPNWICYKIFASALYSDGREFKKTFEIEERSKIFYENERIYTKNYRKVYSIFNGSNLYIAEFLLQNEKMIDAITCEIPSLHYPGEQYFIALTDKGRLLFIHPNNGKLLHAVNLPQGYKFGNLGWSIEFDILYVKGRRAQLHEGLLRPNEYNRRALLMKHDVVFSFFGVLPLRYVGSICIEEGIFGPIYNAFVSQQCLMLVRSKNVMKFYSLDQALENIKLPESPSNELPTSLSIDYFLDLLPALYEIECCSGDNVEIGGIPWRCLYKPRSRKSFVIENLSAQEKKAKCIINDLHLRPFFDSNVCFHPDESGCVLTISETAVTNNDVVEQNGKLTLVPRWTATLVVFEDARGEIEELEAGFLTSSGRLVKRRTFMNYMEGAFQTVVGFHYEPDLNVLAVSVCFEAPVPDSYVGGQFCASRSDPEIVCKGKLVLLNNLNGQVIREVVFDELWNVLSEEHSIELVNDYIVHITKFGSTKSVCRLYRLIEHTH